VVVDTVKVFHVSSLITVQNLVAISHTACARVGGPKIRETLNSRPWRWGVADPQETTPACVLPCQIWLFYVKLHERDYGDPPEKFDPSLPAFQCHSQSLEPTRIDPLSMTSY